MTPLGKLLRCIRLKRNMSELKIARRCGLEIEKYNEIEQDPGKNARQHMGRILEALEMTASEYADFTVIAYNMYHPHGKLKEHGEEYDFLASIDSKLVEKRQNRPNVIDFFCENLRNEDSSSIENLHDS